MSRIRAFFGRIAPLLKFKDSRNYWETRYRYGGNSGEGSRGVNAEYKAQVINSFIKGHEINSIIEFGCGDGHQLAMFAVPQYIGVDVSSTIIAQCRKMYANDPGKIFILLDEYAEQKAQLALSLDVIFHLVEDSIYDQYLERLFAASSRYVIIYSTSVDLSSTGTPHVRHRDFASDVAKRFAEFRRLAHEEQELAPAVRFDRGHPTSFFIYQRI